MSSKTHIFCTFPTNVRKEESGGSGGQGGASTRWRQTQISCWSSQDQGRTPLIRTKPIHTHHTQTNRHTVQPKNTPHRQKQTQNNPKAHHTETKHTQNNTKTHHTLKGRGWFRFRCNKISNQNIKRKLWVLPVFIPTWDCKSMEVILFYLHRFVTTVYQTKWLQDMLGGWKRR